MSLKYTIVVRHPDTGKAVSLLKGETVPDWATDLVHPDDVEPKKPARRPAKKS